MTRTISTTAVLSRAKDYIAKGWCQGTFAIRDNGTRAPSGSPEATAWCSIGAVFKAVDEVAKASGITETYYTSLAEHRALQCLVAAVPMGTSQASLVSYNDTPGRTVDEILYLFDQAMITAHGLENLPRGDK